MTDDDTTVDNLSPAWVRVFVTLAMLFAVISSVVSGTESFSHNLPPHIVVAKDFLIFATLQVLLLFFFLRYRQVLNLNTLQRVSFNNQLDLINELINEQARLYHQIIRQTRSSFYSEFAPTIYQYRFSYRNAGLRVTMEKALDGVVAVVLNLVRNQLAMSNIHEKVSISVKGIVSGQIARLLCDLPDTQLAELKDDWNYIITLVRDADTMAISPEREIRRAVYQLDNDTELSRILFGNSDDFLSNDLAKLARQGHYKNIHPDWIEHYNASLVVPIADVESGAAKPTIYGFLTIDSKNERKLPLFSRERTKPIMEFGADLLALTFLNLEICDRLALNSAGRSSLSLPAGGSQELPVAYP
jgi:hypothetical protein